PPLSSVSSPAAGEPPGRHCQIVLELVRLSHLSPDNFPHQAPRLIESAQVSAPPYSHLFPDRTSSLGTESFRETSMPDLIARREAGAAAHDANPISSTEPAARTTIPSPADGYWGAPAATRGAAWSATEPRGRAQTGPPRRASS